MRLGTERHSPRASADGNEAGRASELTASGQHTPKAISAAAIQLSFIAVLMVVGIRRAHRRGFEPASLIRKRHERGLFIGELPRAFAHSAGALVPIKEGRRQTVNLTANVSQFLLFAQDQNTKMECLC